MCWSPEISLTIGSIGTVTGIYLWNKESKLLTIPLFYFCIMEFLQFFSYFYLDSCSAPPNNILTFVSYIHISLQPILFTNLFMYFHGEREKRNMKIFAYVSSVIVSVILLLKAIPLYPESICKAGETLCGQSYCTVTGLHHLAWQVPLYNFPIPYDISIYYALPVYIIPLFYGAWEGVLFTILLGPVLGYLISPSANEWPAIWCLFSVPLILFLIFKNFKRLKRLDKLSN